MGDQVWLSLINFDLYPHNICTATRCEWTRGRPLSHRCSSPQSPATRLATSGGCWFGKWCGWENWKREHPSLLEKNRFLSLFPASKMLQLHIDSTQKDHQNLVKMANLFHPDERQNVKETSKFLGSYHGVPDYWHHCVVDQTFRPWMEGTLFMANLVDLVETNKSLDWMNIYIMMLPCQKIKKKHIYIYDYMKLYYVTMLCYITLY